MKCDICKKEISNNKFMELILPERGRPGVPPEAFVAGKDNYYTRGAKHPTYTRKAICCRSCCMKLQDILYIVERLTPEWKTKYYNE